MLLRMTDINKFYNGNQVLSHFSDLLLSNKGVTFPVTP